jgi:hypothetical protein
MNNFIYKKGNDGFIITGLKNTSLKKLVIPEGVVRIEKDALSETNIESVWFPKSIKSIGDYAFGLCESLITVVFDDDCDLEEIEEYAFANCFNLKNINFPSSLISIGYNAFYSCASLKKVTIPTSVVKMGANVFEDCSELEQIVLQHSSVPTSFHIYWNSDQTDVILNGKTSGFSSKPVVEKKTDIVIKPYSKSNLATKKSTTTSSPSVSSKPIEKETIKPKSNLDDFIIGENYKWETGIKIAGLKDPSKPIGTLYIPEEVTSIADNAFFQNQTIRKVVGHPNFKYIGSRAFAFCSEITEVELDRKLE